MRGGITVKKLASLGDVKEMLNYLNRTSKMSPSTATSSSPRPVKPSKTPTRTEF